MRRPARHAGSKFALPARKLPHEILFLPFTLVAAVTFCCGGYGEQNRRIRFGEDGRGNGRGLKKYERFDSLQK